MAFTTAGPFPRPGGQNFDGTSAGQTYNITTTRTNFEKIFSGQVMTYFEERSVFLPLHNVITIDHGKSASFAYMGRAGGGYLMPGEEILSKDIRSAEQVLSVDSKLASWVFVNDLDELFTHVALRDRYATELSGYLTRKFDSRIARVIIKAARCIDAGTAATQGWTGYVSGTEDSANQFGAIKTNALMATDAATLIEQIAGSAQTLEEKEVYSAAKYCALRPAQHYMLVTDRTAMNKDWGGSGSLASGDLPEIAGIKLVKSNHIPSTNVSAKDNFDSSANAAEVGDYTGNFSYTTGVVFTADAAGTVRLRGMKMEIEPSVRFQGTLMVASYLQGHGILNPRCAIELATQ